MHRRSVVVADVVREVTLRKYDIHKLAQKVIDGCRFIKYITVYLSSRNVLHESTYKSIQFPTSSIART